MLSGHFLLDCTQKCIHYTSCVIETIVGVLPGCNAQQKMSHVLVHCTQNIHDSPKHMAESLCICSQRHICSFSLLQFTKWFAFVCYIYNGVFDFFIQSSLHSRFYLFIYFYRTCWIPTGDDCKEKQTSRTISLSTGSSRAPWLIEALWVLVTFTGFVLTGS